MSGIRLCLLGGLFIGCKFFWCCGCMIGHGWGWDNSFAGLDGYVEGMFMELMIGYE